MYQNNAEFQLTERVNIDNIDTSTKWLDSPRIRRYPVARSFNIFFVITILCALTAIVAVIIPSDALATEMANGFDTDSTPGGDIITVDPDSTFNFRISRMLVAACIGGLILYGAIRATIQSEVIAAFWFGVAIIITLFAVPFIAAYLAGTISQADHFLLMQNVADACSALIGAICWAVPFGIFDMYNRTPAKINEATEED